MGGVYNEKRPSKQSLEEPLMYFATPLEGIEPPAQEPESCVLSVKLQGQNVSLQKYIIMNIIEFGKNYSPMVYNNKTWVRWLSGTFMRTIQPFRSLPFRFAHT